MSHDTKLRQTVDILKKSIQEGLDKPQQEQRQPDDDWLRTLYTSYSERMRSDNERIWSTGAILLPLAIAGFAAFVAIDSPRTWHVVVLGLASTSLAWCWLFIAENHRAFQQKSEAWLIAIQEIIGISDSTDQKLIGNWANRMLSFRGATQLMRWALVISITLGWIALLILFAASCLPNRYTPYQLFPIV